MNWYQITAVNEGRIKKAVQYTKDTLQVRDTRHSIYVGIAEGELHWLQTMTRDIGVDYREVERPAYEQAPCGIYTTQLRWHPMSCKSCKALRGLDPDKPQKKREPKDKTSKASKNGHVETVVSLPGLQDMSLNGVLSLMKEYEIQLLELYEQVGETIKSIEGLEDLQRQVEEAQEKQQQFKSALSYFMYDTVGRRG